MSHFSRHFFYYARHSVSSMGQTTQSSHWESGFLMFIATHTVMIINIRVIYEIFTQRYLIWDLTLLASYSCSVFPRDSETIEWSSYWSFSSPSLLSTSRSSLTLSVAVSRESKSSDTVQYLKAKSQYITVLVNMYSIEKITLKTMLSFASWLT